jgi:hypothetical protein
LAFDYIITRFFERKRKGHSLLGVSNSQGLRLKKNSSIFGHRLRFCGGVAVDFYVEEMVGISG